MRSPLDGGYETLVLDEVDSTQKAALTTLKKGSSYGVVLARNQTQGVGRFGRTWVSQPGDSLTMTMIFRSYANHPRPYLVGMAVAIAAAGAIHCQLQWPNDLVLNGRKVGGMLTEMSLVDGLGSVPLVGLGINLNQEEFPPEIADRAISLRQGHGSSYTAERVVEDVLARIRSMPEPNEWGDLSPIWTVFDKTPGKTYVLPDGRRALAMAVGSSGQLVCSIDGDSQSVLAADAIFGS